MADRVVQQSSIPAASSVVSTTVPSTITVSSPTVPSSSIASSLPAVSGNLSLDIGADSDTLRQTESAFQALDVNVPDNVKQKIVNGDYIDLGQLLQRRPGPDKSRCLTIEDGLLVVQPKPFTAKITDINQWTDAFVIYASIYSAVHPASTSGLFKYMHTVRLGAKRSLVTLCY